MHTVVHDFLIKYPTVQKKDVLMLLQTVFQLATRELFQQDDNGTDEKNESSAPVVMKKRRSKTEESRRQTADQTLATLSIDDMFRSSSYNFEQQTFNVLCKIAQKVALRGYTKMKKEELVHALEQHRKKYEKAHVAVPLPIDTLVTDDDVPLKKKPKTSNGIGIRAKLSNNKFLNASRNKARVQKKEKYDRVAYEMSVTPGDDDTFTQDMFCDEQEDNELISETVALNDEDIPKEDEDENDDEDDEEEEEVDIEEEEENEDSEIQNDDMLGVLSSEEEEGEEEEKNDTGVSKKKTTQK